MLCTHEIALMVFMAKRIAMSCASQEKRLGPERRRMVGDVHERMAVSGSRTIFFVFAIIYFAPLVFFKLASASRSFELTDLRAYIATSPLSRLR